MNAPAGHIVLVGSMGAGKTTVGKALAERLGRRLVDGDEELRRRTGSTAAAIVAAEGADALHQREAAVVIDRLDGPEPVILAAAASVVDDDTVRARLAAPEVHVIWVRAPGAVLRRRALAGAHRPFVHDDPDAVLRLDRQRAPRYKEVADLAVDEDDRPVSELVDAIVAGLSGA